MVALALALLAAPSAALAQDQPPPGAQLPAPKPAAPKPEENTPEVVNARLAFKRGSDLVATAQWSEALSAFEESAKLRPHAVTTYNVGACERALGRYVLARNTLKSALDENQKKAKQLPDRLITDAKAYIEEIDRLLVRLDVTISPADAAVSVDGRPLEKSTEANDRGEVFLGGVRPPGKGEAMPAARFLVVLDPGAHVFTLSRKGFNDVLVNRTYAPAVQEPLKLELDKLPGTLRISANSEGARVLLANTDVGLAPIELQRPGGSYDVAVNKPGFVLYRTTVQVNPGEEATLNANLEPEKKPITKEWWFWTAAGAIVIGATLGTYFLTRSDPEPVRPALDRGGLGWVVTTP